MLVSLAASAQLVEVYKVDFLPANSKVATNGFTADVVGSYTGTDGKNYSTSGFSNGNNNTTWKYIKCGTVAGVATASITTDFVPQEVISKVVVKVPSNTTLASNIKNLEKCILEASEDGVNWTECDTKTSLAVGANNVFDLSTDGDAKVKYIYNQKIRVVFKCKQGTANGVVWVSGLSFYGKALAEPSWTVNTTGGNIQIGEGYSLNIDKGVDGIEPVVATSNSYKVVNGVLYPLVAGPLTVTVSTPLDLAKKIAAKTETITLNVSKLNYFQGWNYNGVLSNTQDVACQTGATNVPVLVKANLSLPAEVSLTLPNETLAPTVDGTSVSFANNAFTVGNTAGKTVFTFNVAETEHVAAFNSTVTFDVTATEPPFAFTAPATATVGETIDILDARNGQTVANVEFSDASAFVKDASGKWYAVKGGTYTITAKSGEDVKTANITISKAAISFAWVRGSETVNGQSFRLNPAKDELPAVVISGVPANLTVPTLAFTYSADGIATVKDNKIAPVSNGTANVEGKVTVTAAFAGSDAFEAVAANAAVTVDLHNNDVFTWTNDGKPLAGTSLTNGLNQTAQNATLGGMTWALSADPATTCGANFQIGKSGQGATTARMTSAGYAQKYVKTVHFECETSSVNKTGAPIVLIVDDNPYKADTYAADKTTFDWTLNAICENDFGFEFGVNDAQYIKPTRIVIEYSEIPEGAAAEPNWTVPAQAWTYAEGYAVPTALAVPKEVTVTMTPNADDILVVGDKWYPKHAGTVTFTASSEKTTKYLAKTQTVTVEVAKATFVSGLMCDGKALKTPASITCDTKETNLPVLVINKAANLPSELGVVYPTLESVTDGSVTFDATTGKFAVANTGEKAYTFEYNGDANFNAYNVQVTFNVTNNATYAWDKSSAADFVENQSATAADIYMKGLQWKFAATSPVALVRNAGIAVGTKGAVSNFTLSTVDGDFKSKCIKSIKLTGRGDSKVAIIVDGVKVVDGVLKAGSTSGTVVYDAPIYYTNTLEFAFEPGGASAVFCEGIEVVYDKYDKPLVDALWSVEAPTAWELGKESPALVASKVQPGVSVKFATNADDITVNANGTWTPKHAGKIKVNASSTATRAFKAKSVSVEIDVNKFNYLLGWNINGETVNNASLQCISTDTGLPTLVFANLPEGFTAPQLEVTSSNSSVAIFENNTLKPLTTGNAKITVKVADTDPNFAGEAVINVKVDNTPVGPTVSGVKEGDIIRPDTEITLSTPSVGATMQYSINMGAWVDYTGAFTVPASAGKVTLDTQSVKDNITSAGNTVHFYVQKYAPTLAFAKSAIKASTLVALPTNELIVGDDKSAVNPLKVVYSIVSGPATIDAATGVVTLKETAQDGNAIVVKASRQGDDFYTAGGDVTYTITLTTDQIVEFDFTNKAIGIPETLTSETVLSKDGVKLTLQGGYRLNKNADGTYALRFGNKADQTVTIASEAAGMRVVNVAFEGEKVAFSNVDASTGEVTNLEAITHTFKPTDALVVSKIYVSLAKPKSIFVDKIEAKWQDVEGAYHSNGNGLYITDEAANICAEQYGIYNGASNIDFSFAPKFKIEKGDLKFNYVYRVDGTNGEKTEVTTKYRGTTNLLSTWPIDGAYVQNAANGEEFVEYSTYKLYTPCSGVYELKLSLKNPVVAGPRIDTSAVTIPVTVRPSYDNNAWQINVLGAPLTFNWTESLDATNQVRINVEKYEYVHRTYVQFNGEGTTKLWYKLSGAPMSSTAEKPADFVRLPNGTHGVDGKSPYSACFGEIVDGEEGTPSAGYRLYGDDGLDFGKGTTGDLLFEKNGAYSDPIHFTAVEGDAETTDVEMVGAEEGDVEYFTVDGVKIGNAEDLAPGMYVKKVGDKATLVIIK